MPKTLASLVGLGNRPAGVGVGEIGGVEVTVEGGLAFGLGEPRVGPHATSPKMASPAAIPANFI